MKPGFTAHTVRSLSLALAVGAPLALLAASRQLPAPVQAQAQAPVQPPVHTGNLAPVPIQGKTPRALWVWDATIITQPDKAEKFFAFCKAHKVGIAYMSLGDIFSPRKRDASDPKHVTAPVLSAFLTKAHAAGLEVEGLDGDPSFALAENHEAAMKRFVQAVEYNRAVPPAARLDGWQWDTEPYVLPQFKADPGSRNAVMTQFLDSVAATCAVLKKDPILRLGYAVPSFFDAESRAVTWNGSTKPPVFHMMDQLNALNGSTLAIMAYRDKAGGPNGTIAICQGEVDYAAKSAPNVRIWVGQELAAAKGSDPPSISFWEEGTAVMEEAAREINAAFAPSPVYGGIAIHHYASYVQLEARGNPPAAPAP